LADKALTVIGIKNRKTPAVAETINIIAKNSGKNGMECAYPETSRTARPQKLIHTMAHLACRLVGEGKGKNISGRNTLNAYQIGDTIGNDAGFSRACAGKDHYRPFSCACGVSLHCAEVLQ